MKHAYREKIVSYSAMVIAILATLFSYILVRLNLPEISLISMVIVICALISRAIAARGYVGAACYFLIGIVFILLVIIRPTQSFMLDSPHDTFQLLTILPVLYIPMIIYAGLIVDIWTTAILGILITAINTYQITRVLPFIDSKYMGIPTITMGFLMSISFVLISKRIRERNEKDLSDAVIEADRASHAKSIFLASMSHEIRTPMNGIIGMNNLILNSGINEEQRFYAEAVKSSAEFLLTIINDILDFSKIEAGKLDIDIKPYNINKLLDDLSSTLSFSAAEKGLEFICMMDPETPEIIEGDSKHLKQVLLNLAGNALKFTKSGEVSIRGHVDFSDRGKPMLQIEIKDTGIGIPLEKKKGLFDYFYQVDRGISREFGGTGLGLSISKRLIDLMGGDIHVESQQGEGSLFRVSVPTDIQEDGPEKTKIASVRDIQFILCMTNPTQRECIKKQIEHWGGRCVCPEERRRCIALIGRKLERDTENDDNVKPSYILIMEFDVNELKQGSVLEFIGGLSHSGHVGVIALISSRSGMPHSGLIRQFGVQGILTKPVRPSGLKMALSAIPGIDIPPDISSGDTPVSALAIESEQCISILLAEDNYINRELIKGMLKKENIIIDTVDNGRQAIEAFKEKPYDMIFMDCQMPEMDGLDATRAIRELETEKQKKRTPIIAMTAGVLDFEQDRCRQCGMDDFLAKPLDYTSVYDVVKKWTA